MESRLLERKFSRRGVVAGAGAVAAGLAAAAVVGFGDRGSGEPQKSQPPQGEMVQFGPLVVPARQEPIVVQTTTSTRPLVAEPTPYDGAIGRMIIPQFKVNAAVESIGQTDNQLDVPKDEHNVGWYSQFGKSAKPGHGGNAVFTAHVDWWPSTLGPFHDISKMKTGDPVDVVMDNGLEYKYEVFFNESFTKDNIPTGKLIYADDKPADEEWITLITCGGRFKSEVKGGPGEYLDRIVVIAKRKIK